MHSLSKHPGPWLNSVSGIPTALACFRGVQHLYNYALHEKYGPVVRISPNELSFTEAYAWEQIYGNRVCTSTIRSCVDESNVPNNCYLLAWRCDGKGSHLHGRREAD